MTSLRSLLACDAQLSTRFISDERSKVSIAALLVGDGDRGETANFRGSTVVAALPDQLSAAAALLALDGVASRIILWPHDDVRPQLRSAMQSASADVALTAWPLPHEAHTCAASPSQAQAEPCDGQRNTEWVLFTSGTTGQPKLVVHTLESLSGHLWARDARSHGAVWCTFYDIRRYGGLQVFFRALLNGGSLVLSCSEEAPSRFLERAATAEATHFVGTPSHWRKALMTDTANLISPKYIRLSGEAPDQAILDRLRSTYPDAKIVHAFASTEAGLAFEVTDGLAGFPQKLIGQVGGATEIVVQDGTLMLRSARNAIGHITGAAQVVAEPDGFVDTGDTVVLREGRYYFTGRRDGTINVGGLKVHPEEVESVINQHPDVQMSMVLGRANPITGAIVVAKVVPRPGRSPAPSGSDACPRRLQDDIRAFCSSRLDAYKVPAMVSFVDDFTLSPAGKLVRLGA